ncbi:ATP-binding cassette sub-family C member 4 isoform X2 [Nematostella vectensis]|uniref:ATP-binding cassette sub-family C member 4 isoform X2 n=1 Tax=Nematostella vectensis TaxID=45351 RepID=UPI0020773770|nr:ATP-binding cassette sub-family C member 4 isoform X2 [Nematostella vectensis]
MNFSQKTSLGTPLARAGILSRVSFWWLNDLFRKGYDRRLEPDDLYEVLAEDSTNALVDRLECEWQKEIHGTKNKNKSPKLWRAVTRMFMTDILWTGFSGVVMEGAKMGQALLLLLLISYFNPASQLSELYGYLSAGALSLLVFLSILFHQNYYYGARKAGMQLRVAVTGSIYKKVLRLSKMSQDASQTGHIMNLISTDAQKLDEFLLMAHFMWIGPLHLAVATSLIWMELGPSCLVGITLGLLIIPYQSWIGKVFGKLRQKTAVLSDERCKLMNEIISGIGVIKMYTWELPYTAFVNKIRSKEISKVRQTSCIKAVDRAFDYASPGLMGFLLFVTYSLTGNTLSAAVVFSSLALLHQVQVNMARHFPFAVHNLFSSKEFLELNELQYDRMTRLNPQGGEMGVAASAISASWDPSNRTGTLDNISFEIGKGDLLVVVGAVGSGKSSLLMAVLGELPLTRGDIKTRGTIGYASQTAWVFSGTVRQNVMFGQEYNDSRYDKVIRACALDRDIELMPEGDHTLVGEKGLALSGGQKARVNLARAVYYNADVYLLDDPLSSVDTHVGRHLFDACICGLIKDCPRILVTHQLQYLHSATEILCLKEGRVLGIGTYTELTTSGIDFTTLIKTKPEAEETDADSAIGEDTNDSLLVPEVTLEVPETKAIYRRSLSASTAEIAPDNGIAPEMTDELEPEERPRGSIPVKLYLDLFYAGANCCTLVFMSVLFFAAQGSYTITDWWLAHWSDIDYKQNLLNETSGIVTQSPYDRRYYIAVYGGLVLLTFLLSFIRSFLFFYVKVAASKALHNKMFCAVIRAPMYFFDTNPAGRIINRFSKDIGFMDDLLPETFYEFISLAILCFAVVVVNVATMPWVIIGILPLAVAFLFLRSYYLKTGREVKRLEAIGRTPIFNHFSSTLEGLATIRSLSSQTQVTAELAACQDHHSEAWFLFIATSRWLAIRLEMLCLLFVTMAAFTPLFLSRNHDIDAGVVGLTLSYAVMLTGMFQWCVRMSAEVENQMTAVERVVDYSKVEPEGEWHKECSDVPPIWPVHGLITAESLSLQYHATLPRVLKNMCFCVRPKEKVGIVGRTGTGKSSLLAALIRLVEPKGIMRIDGVDITDIGLHDLRSKVSVIPQDPVLFSGSLRHNLDPVSQYEDKELWTALKEVQLGDAVLEFPDGLDTKVTESGNNFSVGQRQLICLARALLRRNVILIIDEATAHVDQRTDALIQKTIRSKFKDCTVLTIAHRLNTIMDMDRVMVLDNGKLVEFEEPFVMLLNPESVFSKLVAETGPDNADKLTEMAKDAFNRLHEPEPLESIPEHLKCNLKSYLPSSGVSSLQIESSI